MERDFEFPALPVLECCHEIIVLVPTGLLPVLIAIALSPAVSHGSRPNDWREDDATHTRSV